MRAPIYFSYFSRVIKEDFPLFRVFAVCIQDFVVCHKTMNLELYTKTFTTSQLICQVCLRAIRLKLLLLELKFIGQLTSLSNIRFFFGNPLHFLSINSPEVKGSSTVFWPHPFDWACLTSLNIAIECMNWNFVKTSVKGRLTTIVALRFGECLARSGWLSLVIWVEFHLWSLQFVVPLLCWAAFLFYIIVVIEVLNKNGMRILFPALESKLDCSVSSSNSIDHQPLIDSRQPPEERSGLVSDFRWLSGGVSHP